MKKGFLKFPFIIAIIISFFSIVPPAGAALFHVIYPYGIQQADDPILATRYTNWLNWFYTAQNGYHRVNYPEGMPCGGNCKSEGMGYGMLLAVWYGDQTTFNELLNFKMTVSPKLGLMANCLNGGSVIDQNSETDADMDIAMALLLAHRRWGDAGAINYGSLATAEINKVASSDVCNSSYNLYPGDYCSCLSNDDTYPSYFTPAWYAEFGEQTGNMAFWNSVKAKAYAMLVSSRSANGLDTEQITYNGDPVGSLDGYASARIPWRYSLDYIWNGDTNSLAQITLDSAFFTGKSATFAAIYDVSGAMNDATHNGARACGASCSQMIAGKAAELNNYYTSASAVFNDSGHFYYSTLALLALIQMSGNCPKVFGSTPTCGCPTSSDLLDDCEDGDNQNNWGGFWYTYFDRGPLNYGTSYVVPNPVSWYTMAGMTPTPFYMQQVTGSAMGGAYAARMTGKVTTAYTYGFIGMGTGTNANSGRTTFTPVDCSMYTGIRFKMKASSNTDNYDFIIIAPKSVTNTGDNNWKYTFTGALNTTTLVIPFTSFTQAVGWGIPTSLSIITHNITDLNWQTNGQPNPNVDLWVDDIEFYPAKPPTPTPTYCPGEKFDGFEDNNDINEFGGDWYTYSDSNGSTMAPCPCVVFYPSAPGYAGVNYAARITGNVVNLPSSAIGMGSDMNADGSARDMSAFVGITFWAKADGNWYNIKLKAGPSVNTGGNEYKYVFKPYNGAWGPVTIPFALFTQESGWGVSVPQADVLQNLKEIQFESKGINHSVDLWVDDIVFNCSQGWTPTITPTWSESATPMPSFTRTPTPQDTDTPVVTETETQLPATQTPAVTETETPMLTDTPTQQDTTLPSATETETSVPETATALETGTGTPQPSYTDTPVPSATDTPAATETGTQLPVLTNTPLATQTKAVTATPTLISAATPTATAAFDKPVLTGHLSYPNPSTGNTVTFRYSHSGFIEKVRISIFTLDGRKIAEVNDANKAPGDSETAWNMRIQLANGLYYYALELTGGGAVLRKNGMFIVIKH